MRKEVKESNPKPINKPKQIPGLHAGIKMRVRLVIAAGLLILNAFAFSLAFAAEIQYDSASRRDPLIPLIGPDGMIARKSRQADLLFEGTITDQNGASFAVINGELYKAGDRIQEAVVIQVFEDRVILVQEDEEKTVWLREEHKR